MRHVVLQLAPIQMSICGCRGVKTWISLNANFGPLGRANFLSHWERIEVRADCNPRSAVPSGAPVRLFADDRDADFSPVRVASVLKEKNPLPGSKLHSSINDRNGLAGARQDRTDVRRHVVTTFFRMFKIVIVFRHKSLEELFQIAPCRRGRVFHDDQTAAGMPNKNRDRSAAHTRLVDLGLNIIRNFIRAFAMRANVELTVLNRHKVGRRN
jgi:hypothetical protein